MKLVTQIKLLILILSLGCKQSNGIVYEKIQIDGQYFIKKKIYDKNGNVSEEVLNKDSIRHGYYKEWKSGKPILDGNFSEGKKEGTWFYMDHLGDTIKVENWLSGKKFGEQIEFFSRIKASAKPILYKYSFIGLNEHDLFTAIFNIDRKLESIKGIPLYCAYNKNNLHAGDSYEMICLLGIPKPFTFNLIVDEIDIRKNKTLYSKNFTNLNLEDLEAVNFGKRFSIDKTYISAGTYSWKMRLDIKNREKIVVSDSVIINIAVD